jgi:hypothetical protein
MNCKIGIRMGRLSLAIVLMSLVLASCSGKKSPTPASFVGKWKSSKLETPLVLYDNGEWEIRKDDGGVLQYGIWEYRDANIIWRFKNGTKIGRDVNAVVSVTDTEFRLKEGTQITVFKRLE